MAQFVKIAPPNSLLFISDVGGGEGPEITPESARLQRFWSTSTCIVFGVLMFQDGETAVTFGDVGAVAEKREPQFEGILETPEHQVIISTSGHEEVMRMPAPGQKTRIRIWTDHPREPENVTIGVGG